MQIIFEKTIIEQIEDAKKSAETAGKTIKEIRLSRAETEQLKRELKPRRPIYAEVNLGTSVFLIGVKIIPYITEADSDF